MRVVVITGSSPWCYNPLHSSVLELQHSLYSAVPSLAILYPLRFLASVVVMLTITFLVSCHLYIHPLTPHPLILPPSAPRSCISLITPHPPTLTLPLSISHSYPISPSLTLILPPSPSHSLPLSQQQPWWTVSCHCVTTSPDWKARFPSWLRELMTDWNSSTSQM